MVNTSFDPRFIPYLRVPRLHDGEERLLFFISQASGFQSRALRPWERDGESQDVSSRMRQEQTCGDIEQDTAEAEKLLDQYETALIMMIRWLFVVQESSIAASH
ncbi:hypothetical protein PoB_006414300 [Plakobranchus ocellatus]|uniref:Uncharacterized protein n=1 Tax=Plakobranchus ocellatus TaxID=259542 RepID=A0AAV4D0I1_9GAST|nr:hypothetical protein PoB_006414300 [Plakobranchus ocellatus]